MYVYKGGINRVDTNNCQIPNYYIGTAYFVKSTITAIMMDFDAHKLTEIECSHETQLIKDMSEMYDDNDGQLLDSTIAVPKANREFKVSCRFFLFLSFFCTECNLQASQWLISARSPVFRRMFAVNMKEAESKRVSIEDFDANVVDQFVRYIHTDSIDVARCLRARAAQDCRQIRRPRPQKSRSKAAYQQPQRRNGLRNVEIRNDDCRH